MTPELVIFDLDGTLVDSLDDLTDAVNHMLQLFGRDRLTPGQVSQLVGKGARNLVQRALESQNPGDIERGLAAFMEFNALHIADKSCLYPGVVELLQRLADRNIRMAVVSNKSEALSRLILKSLGVDGYFGMIAGGDTYQEMKPSPLPLLRVVEELGFSTERTVMVGDSINDMSAGRQAGISTVGCSWGYGGPEELAGADCRADSCAALSGILLSERG